MSVEEKVREVEVVFQRLEAAIASFQRESGVFCPAGCGKCCFKADMEATILELLPFAYHVYQDGKAEYWLERLATNESPYCVLLNPARGGTGMCSDYQYRGLICRLFGYSARVNKYGKREFVTCHLIKTEQRETYENVVRELAGGSEIPVMKDYYMQLYSIDADLGRDFYPFNQAMQKAIETVIRYYEYRVI